MESLEERKERMKNLYPLLKDLNKLDLIGILMGFIVALEQTNNKKLDICNFIQRYLKNKD